MSGVVRFLGTGLGGWDVSADALAGHIRNRNLNPNHLVRCDPRGAKGAPDNLDDAEYDRAARELVFEAKSHAGERTLTPGAWIACGGCVCVDACVFVLCVSFEAAGDESM